MEPHGLPPCVNLFMEDRPSFLRGIIAALEEELRTIPRHRLNIQKVAAREKALAGYRESLRRLDESGR